MIRVLAPVSLAIALAAAAVLWAQESPPPLLPPQAPSGPTPMPAVLRNYTPVTEARLRSPNDGDWMMNRRTYDGWGYSPLTQITPANVARLKPVWSISTGAVNGHEAAPIVHDGVMFVATPGSQVIAIEAATGTVLWRYRRPLAPTVINRHPTTRGVGLLGDKVFLAASDAVLMALDARTGRTVWSTTVADNRSGHYMSLAPLVANGKVLIGTSGGELGIRGFIAAYDPDTGKELWRTYTVPAPGEPGSETWPGGEQWKTGGGSVWVTGNYDPETNLA
jgi:alcohol dehydrogenase (cytochrome c)